MALPTSGIKLGEVRRDPADGIEYRFVTDAWVLNTPTVLEPLASSAGLSSVGLKVGDVRVDTNTGVAYRWSGSAFVLVSQIENVGLTVETAEITNGSVTAAKLAANAVETAKIADANVTYAKLASGVLSASVVADVLYTGGEYVSLTVGGVEFKVAKATLAA